MFSFSFSTSKFYSSWYNVFPPISKYIFHAFYGCQNKSVLCTLFIIGNSEQAFCLSCKSPRCQNSVLYYLFEFRVNRLHKQIQQQHPLLLRVSCKNITLHHSSSVPIPICIFCPGHHRQNKC